MVKLETVQGCLFGGAVGDALGYPVEFLQEADIFARFGDGGIQDYACTDGVACISDDTQMTLFTAEGLMLTDDGSYKEHLYQAYMEWLMTQKGQGEKTMSDLAQVPELNVRRAPGNTCLASLGSGVCGSVDKPINTSKGCGGVMRVAPIGLFLAGRMPQEDLDRLGAEAAAITHGHPLGWLPAAMLVHIVSVLAQQPETSVKDAVLDAREAMQKLYPQEEQLSVLLELTDRALALADGSLSDPEAIRQLGEGWVAEETLAIAVFCAARYENDFGAAVRASVNHSGDSDSTGAVLGNILGTKLGLKGIPAKYLEQLELYEVIDMVAFELAAGRA